MTAYSYFLAHASPDADWARDLYDALQPEPCVLDRVTVGPGTEWPATLLEAQAASRATVVLVSRRAPAAWYLQDEIARALDLMRREGHRVFVVWLDGRPARSQDVPYGLFAINGLDGAGLGPGGVARELVRALDAVPREPIGQAPPRPTASRGALYDIAVAIPKTNLETIARMRLHAPVAEFRTATQAELAMDLVLWAEAQDRAVREALEGHLQRALEAKVDTAIDPVDEFHRLQLAAAATVPIIGFHDRKKYWLRIDDVYVPLGFGQPQRAARMPGPELEATPFEDRDITIEDGCVDLEQRVANGAVLHGLAVVGLPGSGKTTLIKHLYRRVRIHGPEAVGLGPGLTPVQLRASRVLEGMPAEGRAEALLRVTLADVLEREVVAAAPALAGVGKILAGRPLLLLVDALDEAGGENGLRDVCDWLERTMLRDPRHRWVVTCRFAAWARTSGQLQSALTPLHVRDLTLEAANRYVRAWFSAVARRDDRASDTAFAERAQALADAITDPRRFKTGRLRDMVGNPLMLSLTCLVQHELGDLPEARAKLYEECLGVLLRAWAEAKAVTENVARPQVHLDVEAAIRLLMPLAERMQHEQDGDEPVDVPRGEVEALFKAELPKIRGLSMRAPHELVELLSAHCGVLHSPDLRRYRFVHLSLQEYLAARAAEVRGDAGAQDLARRLGDVRWTEPILLALSRGTLAGAFWRAVLAAPEAPAHEDLLREGLEQGNWFDDAPFVEVLAAAGDALAAPWWLPWRRRGPSADTVALVLRLLATRETPAIREAATRLVRHPHPEVAALAGTGRADRPPDRRERGARLAVDCGGIPLDLVWVPPGTFWMGATRDPGQNHDAEASELEAPVREVTLTQGFWLGRHPVTVAQFRAFCAATGHPEPEAFRRADLKGDTLPVTYVAWEDARAFAAWLSPDGARGELPTEAEWEWAARGPVGHRYPWGDASPTLERAWYGRTGIGAASRLDPRRPEQPGVDAPAPVGQRASGASWVGAEDLAGNVWEWCLDAWGERHMSDVVDPCRHDDNPEAPRVLRGGSWHDPAWHLRCSTRDGLPPGSRLGLVGFRVVLRPGSSVVP